MKKKIGAVILAGMFLVGTASVTMAKGPGGGSGGGSAVRSGAGAQNQVGTQQRLRDGSCVNQGTGAGAAQKKGSTYGPGDGTGTGVPVKDGTGYGAPANR